MRIQICSEEIKRLLKGEGEKEVGAAVELKEVTLWETADSFVTCNNAHFLGLGTNLGDREMNLVTARDLLMKHDVLVMGQSEIRETEPLGGLDQPKYLNQVIECSTELDPFCTFRGL